MNCERSTQSQKALHSQGTDRAAETGDQDGLGQDHEQHQPPVEADRLQDGHLAGSLAHRHGHGIARDAEE